MYIRGNEIVLEEKEHKYLGDSHALSAEEARKQVRDSLLSLSFSPPKSCSVCSRKKLNFGRQADRMFDSFAKVHDKVHKRKVMSASAARADLFSFFDTLGLNGDSKKKSEMEKSKNAVAKKKIMSDVSNSKVEDHKTTVNIYIKEKVPEPVKDKKAAVKSHAALLKKSRSKDGPPIPLVVKARQQELADRPMSRYEREMREAKDLLKKSKLASALSQARSISLKADAPYYTS